VVQTSCVQAEPLEANPQLFPETNDRLTSLKAPPPCGGFEEKSKSATGH